MATSNSSGSFRRKENGFTLFEILIVMSIIAILSMVLVGYSRQSSRQLALATSQAKLTSLVSRAKFLALQTYFRPPNDIPFGKVICGYGVKVEARKIFIFQDIDTTCSANIDSYIYSGDDVELTGELNELNLENSVISIVPDDSFPELDFAIFVPPEPLVKINEDSLSRASVVLTDGGTEVRLVITEDGQIGTQ